MDLSIIIVSWNVREKLKNCLNHLFQSQTKYEFETFVIDNASRDESAEMVAKYFSEVKVSRNDGNVGFARAVNEAFRKASGDYILLLNPDTFVKPYAIDSVLQWLKINRQAAAAGCRLIDEKENIVKHVRRFPRLFDQLAIICKWPYLFPKILDKYLQVNFDYDQAKKVDTVRGGFLMIRRDSLRDILSDEDLENGRLLDERYFVWFEDVDFCRAAKKAEKEIWYTPAGTCVDLVGQSFKQLPRLTAQKYFRDSMLSYFKKWHPRWQYRILAMAWPWGLFLTWLFTKLGFESRNNT